MSMHPDYPITRSPDHLLFDHYQSFHGSTASAPVSVSDFFTTGTTYLVSQITPNSCRKKKRNDTIWAFPLAQAW